jgi:hypothetical protein
MNRVVVFLLTLVLASGCAGRFKAGSSFVGNLSNGVAVQKIAEDAAACLATLYPPGLTTVQLNIPQSQNNFSPMFETSLRGKGFTVSSTGAVTVAYILDELRAEQPPVWYLQLRIADLQGGKTITRSYTAAGQPEAGFSSTATGSDTEE